jgi:hypothetical protein
MQRPQGLVRLLQFIVRVDLHAMNMWRKEFLCNVIGFFLFSSFVSQTVGSFIGRAAAAGANLQQGDQHGRWPAQDPGTSRSRRWSAEAIKSRGATFFAFGLIL